MEELIVMISSKNEEEFPSGGVKLSEIRKELKQELEDLEVFGKKLIKVWINEDQPAQSGDKDSWDVCMQAAVDSHILIVLYGGIAGWTSANSNIGICHAELREGYEHAPAKVHLIKLKGHLDGSAEDTPDGLFQRYVEERNLFRTEVSDKDELKTAVKEAVRIAILDLAKLGLKEASKGQFYMGQALDWSELSFDDRRVKIAEVLRKSMLNRQNSKTLGDHPIIKINNEDILVVPDAIPAALSIGAAKELVGQPFLQDYKLSKKLKKNMGGPIHIIGCNKNVTETQAMKILGFPDAAVINAPFGVFVADNIQKIQIAFIANCRDESSTRYGLQRFFKWIEQAKEDIRISKRAMARARITNAIAKETTL